MSGRSGRHLARLGALVASTLAFALVSGCAPATTGTEVSASSPVVPIESVSTGIPESAQPEPTPTDAATTDEPPVSEPPAGTETPAPHMTTAPATGGGGAPQATGTTASNRVKIGTNDYSVLNWRVVCTGLDREPSILATADGPDATKYVIMLLAGADGQLISLSFSAGPANSGHSANSGLTVTPATGQGVGTFLASGEVVASEGRGVSYGPYDQDFSADTIYSVELDCGGK